MAEWLVEDGIGEHRAMLVHDGEVLAAQLRWPGELLAGSIVEARLLDKKAGSRRGTARDNEGREILVDALPGDTNEGTVVKLEITRAAIAERGRMKRAQGRIAPLGRDLTPATARPSDLGKVVRRFPPGFWEDLWDRAAPGEVNFVGGSLLFSVTPAMTVVDIDGDLPARKMALAAVAPLTRALRLFDLGGSIGIDFPTLVSRDDRTAVDAALDHALADWPHERTSMSGFGFVHIVARLHGPSLLHRFVMARTGMAVRMALRRAEMVEGPGVTLLTVHPALKAKLAPQWLAELERRTGRTVRVETDPALAIEAPHAQLLAE